MWGGKVIKSILAKDLTFVARYDIIDTIAHRRRQCNGLPADNRASAANSLDWRGDSGLRSSDQ